MAPRVHSSPTPPTPLPPRQPRAMCTVEQSKQVFTVWMKSLMLNGHGCTVYDSNGRVIYRVDNYGSRCSGSVFLTDLDGNIILHVLKKKLVFGRWEGYKWRVQEQEPRPWFTVTRPCSPFQWWRRQSSTSTSSSWCEFQGDTGRAMRYTIADECRAGKQGCMIVDDATGLVVAAVKRKTTAAGVALGYDVLALVVEPDVDHSLVMGLVLVYGLMNHIM